MNRKVGLGLLSGLAVLSLSATLSGCAGLELGGSGAPAPTPSITITSPSTPTPSPTPTVAPVPMTDAQIAQSLNVPQGSTLYDFDWDYPQEFTDLVKAAGWPTEWVDGQEIPVFKGGSNDWRHKLFLDGVQPPLTTNDMDGVLLAILTRPDTGAQVNVGLDMTKYGGPSNPWGPVYFGGIDNVKAWATKAMSTDPQVRLVAAKELALVAMRVTRYTDMGVQVRDTVFNIRTARENEGGLAVDPSNPTALSRFLINTDQYRGTFVVFAVVDKGMPGCTPEEFGVNTLDGRFAMLQSICKTTVPNPNCTSPCHPPVVTTCVVEPGGTKVWDANLQMFICKGPPTEDPDANGNSGDGGGLNGGAGTLTPVLPKPTPTPTPTPDPGQGGNGNSGDPGL